MFLMCRLALVLLLLLSPQMMAAGVLVVALVVVVVVVELEVAKMLLGEERPADETDQTQRRAAVMQGQWTRRAV